MSTDPQAPLSKEELKAHLKSLLRKKMGGDGEGWYPLSDGQESLWFLWELKPESPAFSMAMPLSIHGALDRAAFDSALAQLADRHPCLRTEFQEQQGVLRQRPRPETSITARYEMASDWSDDTLHEALRTEARRPFDLTEDARLRVTLWQRSETETVLLIVLHHIVGDLWSLIILMDELRDLYAAYIAGQKAELPALSVRFEDYVRAAQTAKERGGARQALAYWAAELEGELPSLDIQTDHPRPARQSFDGGTVFQTIDSDLLARVEDLARKQDTTLFVLLLAAYQVLLHRFSGQERIITGTPFSGRTLPGTQGVIGDFVNVLPLKADFEADTRFTDHVAALRDRLLGAMKHQDVPFSQIVEQVAPVRDLSRPPLFQTTFVLQKFHRYPELQNTFLSGAEETPVPFADLQLSGIPLAQQDGQFDLNLEAKKDSLGRLQAAWKYDAALFEPATIEGIAACYRALLDTLTQTPDAVISTLPLLEAAQSQEVITASQGPVIQPPREKSVAALFETWAQKTPDARALSCGDETLSYAEARAQMLSLAAALASLGVGPEVMTSLVLPRGLSLALGMLGVMRAGGAFLPLSPDTPRKRLAQVVALSESKLILTVDDLKTDLAAVISDLGSAAPRLVTIEELMRMPVAADAANLPNSVQDHDLAYMMFTSGSTGTPKGVMVEHIGMVNHTLGKLEDLEFGPSDCLAQNAPASFDVVVWQNLAPLACGGSVQIITDPQAEDPVRLFAECIRRGVTALQVVPSMMRALIEEAEAAGTPPDLGPLRWIVPTGEALPRELCVRWFALYPEIPILNTYGSTECSDDQCHYALTEVNPADDIAPIITVGRPIRNMSAYVLDPELNPVPPGVVGELYIGGIGVGRGYRGDPEKTAAAFLPDPFSSDQGARLYRSRDMARRRHDGLIDFLGRLDNMVKINGVRIEPTEIEANLIAHPDISAAIVQARTHPSGALRLVAYIVATPQADLAAIRAHLSQRLPFAALPDLLIQLKALPLTPNGKHDLKALPDPEWQDEAAQAPVPPQTETQRKIAAIWSDILGRQNVSIKDDFFASGGDSIASIKVAARAKEMGLPLEVVDIFIRRTIEAISEKIDVEALSSDDKDALKTVSKAAALEQAQKLMADGLLSKAASMVTFDTDDDDT